MHGHRSLPFPLLSFPSSFISFIFLSLVPQALVTPPSRLTAGWNWDWQSRVMVAGHQGLTVKERERESRWVICHRVNGVTTLSIDLSEWALKLYYFSGAVELDWAWKLESDFTQSSILAQTKPVVWVKNSTELFNNFSACFCPLSETKPSQICPCFTGASIWNISVDTVQLWCAVMAESSQKEGLKQCHFNWD